eukprot:m.357614 g.357614  ORF g.357614 m.357614 type:complete len:310 (+) comp17885_c0_seq1:206-1135(+)
MGGDDTMNALLAQWRDMLERATQFDSWGQLVEACNEYTKLANSIRNLLVSEQREAFPDSIATFMNKASVAVRQRIQSAQDLSGAEEAMSLRKVQSIGTALKSIPDQVPAFPIDGIQADKHIIPDRPRKASADQQTSVATVLDDSDDEDDTTQAAEIKGGSLLPRSTFPGQRNITIRIDKIKIKDASSYFDPFFTISVVDGTGKHMAPQQDTPTSNKKGEYVEFFQDVEIPVSYEDLPSDGAIFLEFKHFKPKKAKTSTKCFCLMEKDELNDGQCPLEVYAKPTDFKKKKLQLLTDKPHYLYVTVTVTQN